MKWVLVNRALLTLLTLVVIQRNGHEADKADNESDDIDDDQEAMDVEIVLQGEFNVRSKELCSSSG